MLNNLFMNTRLQQRFNCNIVALVDRQPLTIGLRDLFREFLKFRVETVENRANHDLEAAAKRHHIVDGYLRVFGGEGSLGPSGAIDLIKSASDSAAAEAALRDAYDLSTDQAKSVLALPLRRLTGMEISKLKKERDALVGEMGELRALLESREMVLEVVKTEAMEVADTFADERRSQVLSKQISSDLGLEDLVPNDPCIIVVSERGYVKRMKEQAFQVQGRNTKGKLGGKLRPDDLIAHVFHAKVRQIAISLAERVPTLPSPRTWLSHSRSPS